MKVKIKHEGVLKSTPKALLVDNYGKKSWLPTSQIKIISEFKMIIPKWLAEKHGFYFSEIRHIPKEINPQFNQEADNELRISN